MSKWGGGLGTSDSGLSELALGVAGEGGRAESQVATASAEAYDASTAGTETTGEAQLAAGTGAALDADALTTAGTPVGLGGLRTRRFGSPSGLLSSPPLVQPRRQRALPSAATPSRLLGLQPALAAHPTRDLMSSLRPRPLPGPQSSWMPSSCTPRTQPC